MWVSKVYGVAGILVILRELIEVQGYGSGAPVERCLSMVPGHLIPASSDECPFQVIPSSQNVCPGEQISLKLLPTDGESTFKGFLVRLKPRGRDLEKGFGKFSLQLHGKKKAQTLDCFGNKGSGITHVKNDPKKEVIVDWVAPATAREGEEFEILATFVQSFFTYWPRQVQPLRIRIAGNGCDPAKTKEAGQDLELISSQSSEKPSTSLFHQLRSSLGSWFA